VGQSMGVQVPPSMYLSEAISVFARYSLGVAGYTRKTHITYPNRQRQFANRLAERKHLADIQVQEIPLTAGRSEVRHLEAQGGNCLQSVQSNASK
jgi:hypothetical protein